MSSKLLYHRKWILGENELIEVKAWKVPVSDYYPEGIKYSLVYIRKGQRVLAYDNYLGHGPHRHYLGST
ncbi:toxin-antitoxin system TumE family protein [Thermodesulfatator autotrophicus]|uniref:toxin-antitoxin system TumE family protein n=1 Tax=Thermodesulfatator autotrophicus TaxID=1795632 RepID=UPI0038B6373B